MLSLTLKGVCVDITGSNGVSVMSCLQGSMLLCYSSSST